MQILRITFVRIHVGNYEYSKLLGSRKILVDCTVNSTGSSYPERELTNNVSLLQFANPLWQDIVIKLALRESSLIENEVTIWEIVLLILLDFSANKQITAFHFIFPIDSLFAVFVWRMLYGNFPNDMAYHSSSI